MDEQRPLTEEELLAAAEAAYEQGLAMEQQAKEEQAAVEAEPVAEEANETLVQEEVDPTAEIESAGQTETDKPAEQPKKSNSTTFTVCGIAVGLVAGAALGFLTGSVPGCVIGGVLVGLLIGLFVDTGKDKRQNQPAVSILDTEAPVEGEEFDQDIEQPVEENETHE